MKVKNCLHCGQVFLANHAAEGFCSSECRRRHINRLHFESYHRRHKPPQEKPCSVCGKMFQPHHNREILCSAECKHKRRLKHNSEFYQRKLTHKRQPFDKPYREYLAHLESTYGYADDGTIRAAIDSWFEGRN